MPPEPGRPAPAEPDFLRPDWDAPPGIAALMSTRRGGVSTAPFDSLDLRLPDAGTGAAHAAALAAVQENRRRLAAALGGTPVYLEQVHGADVLRLDDEARSPAPIRRRADASVTRVPGLACTVLVADCLPVLICSDDGSAVGAAHAGWRGLAGGVLDNTVAALCDLASCPPQALMAWLGPCIGPRQFEVGEDVLHAFGVEPGPPDDPCFVPRRRPDGSPRWLADLPQLARGRLARLGLRRISGGQACTVEEHSRFFSFRRDGLTGRMGAAICILR